MTSDYIEDEFETYTPDDCSACELNGVLQSPLLDERLKKEALSRLEEMNIRSGSGMAQQETQERRKHKSHKIH